MTHPLLAEMGKSVLVGSGAIGTCLRETGQATGEPVEILNLRRPDSVRALLRHQCDRARRCYRKADASLPETDARRVVAARIMAAIYLELLTAIERSGYDVFSRVIRVPRPRRAVIAATTWLGTMTGLR